MNEHTENTTTPPDGWRCPAHLQHVEKMAQIEKFFDKHEKVHKEQINCIQQKVPNRLFYLLITILVIVTGGMLTFQWENYKQLNSLEVKFTKEIAIVQTQLDSHMKSTIKLYKNGSNETK